MYRVSDVDFEMTPMSTFDLCTGEVTTFMDYFQTQHNIQVGDMHQPLLVCFFRQFVFRVVLLFISCCYWKLRKYVFCRWASENRSNRMSRLRRPTCFPNSAILLVSLIRCGRTRSWCGLWAWWRVWPQTCVFKWLKLCSIIFSGLCYIFVCAILSVWSQWSTCVLASRTFNNSLKLGTLSWTTDWSMCLRVSCLPRR